MERRGNTILTNWKSNDWRDGEGGKNGLRRAGASKNKQMSKYIFKMGEEGHLALAMDMT